MNVLIVDDDITIGSILCFWLQEPPFDSVVEEVIYAQSAQDAMQSVQERTFDLAFIDVNMPLISGISLTVDLKREFPSMMIVAISSDKESEVQTKMCHSGAYDYLVKPLVYEVFANRLKTYELILSQRKKPKYSVAMSNAFGADVFNYNIEIPIVVEENLTDIWDVLLLRFGYEQRIISIHDAVKMLYELASEPLKYNIPAHVVIEENDAHLYVSLIADECSVCNYMDIIRIYRDRLEIKTDDTLSVISIKMDFEMDFEKEQHTVCALPTEMSLEDGAKNLEQLDVLLSEVPQSCEVEVKATQSLSLEATKTVPLQVFNMLQQEDAEDFSDELYNNYAHISNMQYYDAQLVSSIAFSLEHMSALLNTYNEFRVMESVLSALAKIFKDSEVIEAHWENCYLFIRTIFEDITNWYQALFVNGATSIDFMDASFTANVEQIEAILYQQNSEESLDDLFF